MSNLLQIGQKRYKSIHILIFYIYITFYHIILNCVGARLVGMVTCISLHAEPSSDNRPGWILKNHELINATSKN